MERTETLCWDCQRAFGNEQCSWARGTQPVQGWEAIDTRLRSVSNGTSRSYRVSACPLFLADEPRPAAKKQRRPR